MLATWFGGPRASGRRRGHADALPLLCAADWAEVSHAVGHDAAHAVAPVPARQPNPGEGRSRLRGRGLDYAHSRAYQSGDDVRAMHWALLARTGRPYVRVHEEEHAAPRHAMVDAHGGMLFGTRIRTKAAQAARVALLGAALQASSTPRASLGLTLWTDDGLRTQGFGCGPVAVRRMATWLMAQTITPPDRGAGDGSATMAAFDAWVNRLRARAQRPVRVMLCSDFAWLDRHEESTLWTLAAQSQILSVDIADPVELALPDLSIAHFRDAVAGVDGWLEPDPAMRAWFLQASQRRHARIRQELRAVGARVAHCLAGADAPSVRADLLPLMR